MEWFSNWWNSLELVQQILYCIAIPSSLVLIIQTIIMLLGIGHGGEGFNPSDTSGLGDVDIDGGADLGADVDIDIDGDMGDIDGSHGDVNNSSDLADFRLLSVQSVIAFLTIFSWSGITALSNGMVPWGALLLAAALGFGAMFLVAKIIQWSSKLAQNGTFNVKNLLGESGTVYIPIPSKGSGTGKINISCGERFMEFDAVTEEQETLKTGTAVRVVDIIAGATLVVEKVS
ncbi:MAG: NfeD family protein [Firmicutes bacterium]|nr:NfeD family protein [[Eubacterium] siraeum]MCM1487741.1 NfeD family protein [Bacillota bacterium]